MANRQQEALRERATPDVRARFWAKVERRGANDCWLWTGGRDRAARVAVGEPLRLHRREVSVRLRPAPVGHAGERDTELAVAAVVAAGLVVMHACDNPPCCNPRHLSLGTNADNMRDAAEKGRLWRQRMAV